MPDIFIYKPIGAGGVTAADVIPQIQAAKGGALNVRINSPGGSVFEGLAIFNALNAYAGKVTVYVDGLAASIASTIAMAGDEIRMAANAMMMIHRPRSTGPGGVADEMRNTADALEKMEQSMADIYADRTKRPVGDVMALMDAETWFSAKDAKAAGLCDVIEPAKSMAACFDLSAFKNAPAPVDTGASGSMEPSAQFTPVAGFETAEAAQASVATAVAAALETAKAEFEAAKVAAVREAIETATKSHSDLVAALRTEHTAAIDSLKAEHGKTVAQLEQKLQQAEALSASNLGVPPVAPTAPDGTASTSPSDILAKYRELSGDKRQEFYAKHKDTIWKAYDSENARPPQ